MTLNGFDEARINRMSAAEATAFVRALFRDERWYAVARRGYRDIMRLDKPGGFCIEVTARSHRVRRGEPGTWTDAIRRAIAKVEQQKS